jgi:hypothetical protein
MAGVLVGALLSGFFVLVGARVAATSEHERWLRDQRYEAWSEAFAFTNRAVTLPRPDFAAEDRGESSDAVDSEETRKTRRGVLKEAHALNIESAELLGRLRLLGPDHVGGPGGAMVVAAAAVTRVESRAEQALRSDEAAEVTEAFITVASAELQRPLQRWWQRRNAVGLGRHL